MTKLPDSPKKKARENKKIVVNFSETKEELTVFVDEKWVRYFNAEKVLKLIEDAKKYKETDTQAKIVTVCNLCGVEDGHSSTCEMNSTLPN